MATFDSEPFAATPLRTRFVRADIELHGVDQAVPSYEARIFLSNPDATAQTEPTPDNRYVGSFSVFGKLDCWGDEGHCDEPVRGKFERRRAPTRYAKIRVRTPEGLLAGLARAAGDHLTLNIVVLLPEHPDYERFEPTDVLRFSRLAIVTYAA